MKLRTILLTFFLGGVALPVLQGSDVLLAADDGAPAPRAGGASSPDPDLAAPFESQAHGIALRPPAGWRQIRRGGGDEVVQFLEDQSRRTITVVRRIFETPTPLTTSQGSDGQTRQGVLESRLEKLKRDYPGTEQLRLDAITVTDVPVGMLAARFNVGTETKLLQEAVAQVNESQYFILTMVSPAQRGGEVAQDANSQAAVSLFGKIVDSVRVLDQEKLRADQEERLFRTRALLVTITEERLRAALVPERWLRITHEGKDIGYSYVLEELGSDLPRRGAPRNMSRPDGVLVGIRTRTKPDVNVQVDAESWLYVGFDKKQEKWSTIGYVVDSTPGRSQKPKTIQEGGVAVYAKNKPVKDPLANLEEGNRGIRLEEEYRLTVTQDNGMLREVPNLPPFYLPQALAHLLPRLVADSPGKTYMFATYATEKDEVYRRYVDVEPEADVTFNGKRVRAVRVRDHVGLEGSVTTHYVTRAGEYLGSINEDSKLVITPTDAATLERLWPKTNLTRPGEVDKR